MPNPGLIDPIDGNSIISPGEIIGGDSVVLLSTMPVYAQTTTAKDGLAIPIGLVQGLNITASRMLRSIYQIGSNDPVIVSSVGDKSMNIASIITEERNTIKALYRWMIENRDNVDLGLSQTQIDALEKADGTEITEGLARELVRIPFGLNLIFQSGDGDVIQTIHLGHCMLGSDSGGVEAGTRGVSEVNMIMWQKTTYIVFEGIAEEEE